MKSTINCWNCKKDFAIAKAEFCDDSPYMGYPYKTLMCPHCGYCACSQIEKWANNGKLVPAPEGSPFQWIHKDLEDR